MMAASRAATTGAGMLQILCKIVVQIEDNIDEQKVWHKYTQKYIIPSFAHFARLQIWWIFGSCQLRCKWSVDRRCNTGSGQCGVRTHVMIGQVTSGHGDMWHGTMQWLHLSSGGCGDRRLIHKYNPLRLRIQWWFWQKWWQCILFQVFSICKGQYTLKQDLRISECHLSVILLIKNNFPYYYEVEELSILQWTRLFFYSAMLNCQVLGSVVSHCSISASKGEIIWRQWLTTTT